MGDMELPQDILSVLPTDPYEQLDVARKITSMAVSVRTSELESETAKLQQKVSEKEGIINELQQYVSKLEKSLQESADRLSQAIEDKTKLQNEKDTLAASVKKLNRDVKKLEIFKRTLMQSLQDDDEKDEGEKSVDGSVSSSTDSLNVRADVDPPAQISSLQSTSDLAPISTFPDHEVPNDSEVKAVSQKPSSTTPKGLTPQQSPAGSPRWSSTEHPEQSPASVSPRWRSAPDARVSIPSSDSTSQHTTAPNSPPPPQPGSAPAHTPRVDGKEFFRQARNRLSYEQFSAFLAVIKELNAHRQTKEETLEKAEEIFGPENSSLYAAFNALLSRHLPT